MSDYSEWGDSDYDPGEMPAAHECNNCKGTGTLEDTEGDPHKCPICRGTGIMHDWNFKE